MKKLFVTILLLSTLNIFSQTIPTQSFVCKNKVDIPNKMIIDTTKQSLTQEYKYMFHAVDETYVPSLGVMIPYKAPVKRDTLLDLFDLSRVIKFIKSHPRYY